MDDRRDSVYRAREWRETATVSGQACEQDGKQIHGQGVRAGTRAGVRAERRSMMYALRCYATRNGLLLLAVGFAALYFPAFYWLGHRPVDYHTVGIPFDRTIPFNEWFIIPYLGWFAFMAVGVLYVYVTDKDEARRLAISLAIGMALSLSVYLIFPNKVLLRPESMPHDNPLTALTLLVYHVDTAGNALASVHVYNTVVLTVALLRTPRLKRHRWLAAAVMGFAGSIILSTFFIKQHSVIDALVALAMAGVICSLVYASAPSRHRPTTDGSKELVHVSHPHL
jgi:hypothetical protein